MGPRNPSPDPKKSEGVDSISASLCHLTLHSSVDKSVPELELSLAQFSLNKDDEEEEREIRDEEENQINEEKEKEYEKIGYEEREKNIKEEEEESDDEGQLKENSKEVQYESKEDKKPDRHEVKEREAKKTKDKEKEICQTEIKQESVDVRDKEEDEDAETKEKVEDKVKKIETVKRVVIEDVSEEEEEEEEKEEEAEEEESSDDENPSDGEEEEVPRKTTGASKARKGKGRVKLASRGLNDNSDGYYCQYPYGTHSSIMPENEFPIGQQLQTQYVDMSPRHPSNVDYYMYGGSPQYAQTPNYSGMSPQHIGTAMQYADSPTPLMPKSPALSVTEENEIHTSSGQHQVSNQEQLQSSYISGCINQVQFHQQHQVPPYSCNLQQDYFHHDLPNQQQGMPLPCPPYTPMDSPQLQGSNTIEDVLEILERDNQYPNQEPVSKEEVGYVNKIQEQLEFEVRQRVTQYPNQEPVSMEEVGYFRKNKEGLEKLASTEDKENSPMQNRMGMQRGWPKDAYQLSWKMELKESVVVDWLGTLCRKSDQEIVEKDKDGDTMCMIAACSDNRLPQYRETLVAIVKRQQNINICCDKRVESGKKCRVCCNENPKKFYSSLSMMNNQGFNIISSMVTMKYPPAIVDFLLSSLRDSDIARIFTPEKCNSYASYVRKYPGLRSFLQCSNGFR